MWGTTSDAEDRSMFLIDPLQFVSDDHRTRLQAAAGYRAAAPVGRTTRRHRRAIHLRLPHRAA